MTALVVILCLFAAAAVFGVGYVSGNTSAVRRLARREAAAREVEERTARSIASSLGDNYRPGLRPPTNPFDGMYNR